MKYSILLLASIFLIGCNGEQKYESPAAVYEAAQVASKERNMEDLMNCLTEDSQKDIVNQVIGMSVLLGLGDLPDKDLPKPVAKMQKAMKKHGLSQTVLKELEEGTDYPIKDKAQFVGDFFNSMDIPKSKNLPAIWTDFLEPKGTLENLSIDGDTASATVVSEGSKATIIFTQLGESWLIDRHKATLSPFEQLGKKPDYPASWPDLSSNLDKWKTSPLSTEEANQLESILESATRMDSFDDRGKFLIARIPSLMDSGFAREDEHDLFGMSPLLLNGKPFTGFTKNGPEFIRFELGKQTFQVTFKSDTEDGQKQIQSWDALNLYKTEHPKRGSLMKWNENGTLVDQLLFKDGIKYGLHFLSYGNGNRMYETLYEEGKKHGAETYWHENGQKKSVYIYKNGVLNGPYSNWHDNGQLYSQSAYQNGKRHGEYKRWHSNGQQWAIRIHENGKTISAKWWNSRGKEVESEAQSRKE